MRVERGNRCSSCTLSFKRDKNFIPGKHRFFSLCLSGKICKDCPQHSCCSHTHSLSHSPTNKDRRCFFFFFLKSFSHPSELFQTPPTPRLPKWASRNRNYELANQTSSAAARRWLGSSHRGSGLTRNAQQQARPDTLHLIHSIPHLLSARLPSFTFLDSIV